MRMNHALVLQAVLQMAIVVGGVGSAFAFDVVVTQAGKGDVAIAGATVSLWRIDSAGMHVLVSRTQTDKDGLAVVS